MNRFLILALLGGLTITGCASSDYQRNMADLTNRNVRYLRSLGYHVVKIDRKSGFIEAYKPNGEAAPHDLKMFYPNQQINPYRAVNTASGNQDISSITAYWLPGKDQLEKREHELTKNESSVQASVPSYSPSVAPIPDNASEGTETLTKLQHKTL